MKFIIALALFVVAANAHLNSRNIEIPAWKLNPEHTLDEWQEILADQEYKPEVVENYKRGTVRQPWNAGRVMVDPKTIGVSNAVVGQFPWQVAVTLDRRDFCGGSLISPTWVMTAAHCARGIAMFSMIFGTIDIDGATSGSVIRTSTSATVHAGYSTVNGTNDIAVVSIIDPLPSNPQISPVRLPKRSQAGLDLAGKMSTVSGWGRTSDAASLSADLQHVDLPIVTNAECANYYGSGIVTDTVICASTTEGGATCIGDSGGPVVVRDTDGVYSEIGVVAFWSPEGCAPGYPIGFTRVTSYLGWIETITGIAVEN